MKKILEIIKKTSVTLLLMFSVVTILRFFALDVYYVPSNSMDETIKQQEYILTNKLLYGPRWFGKNKLNRLPGFSRVKRNDIVVFNFPEGDTVLSAAPSQNYYSFQRRIAAGKKVNQKIVSSGKNYISMPNRIAYVKRCVALPGDTLEIKDAKLYIDGMLKDKGDNYKMKYKIQGEISLITSALKNAGINRFKVKKSHVIVHACPNKMKIWKRKHPEHIVKQRFEYSKWINSFPSYPDRKQNWNRDNYGPLYIPKAGDTLTITLGNLPTYKRLICAYEGNRLEIKDSTIYINNVETNTYVVKQNYYFMMGDNRYFSIDSRNWGFVPEDHLIGKAQMILSSEAKNGNIRWDRIGTVL